MNSISNDNLKNNLSIIRAELSKYDEMTRKEFFNEAINNRLKNTLYIYNIETDKLSDFLIQQHGMRVLKAITKIQKADDKKVIYDNMKGALND